MAASGAQAEGETSYQMAAATCCRWCVEWGMWLYSQVVMDFGGGQKMKDFWGSTNVVSTLLKENLNTNNGFDIGEHLKVKWTRGVAS